MSMSFLEHRDAEERPWGSFARFTHNEISTVKILTILPGKRLSLQEHKERKEFWKILSGTGVVTRGKEEYPATEGDEFEIPPQTPHRVAAGPDGLTLLEIALGNFDENDEIRIEDDYSRPSPARPAEGGARESP